MNKKQKIRYLLAIYIIIALFAIILGFLGFNRDQDNWQVVFLNLSTELLGVVIFFFLIKYFFALDEWNLSERVEKLVARVELFERRSSQVYFLESLSNEQQIELKDKLQKSKDLLIIGVALKGTLERFYPIFKRRLRKGHTIRVILEEPISHASQMTVKRRYSYETEDLNSWQAEVKSTLQRLEKLRNDTSGNLEIRTIDVHLPHGAILVDRKEPNGMLFGWYYSFMTEEENVPKFLLYTNDKWFPHFAQEAEALWAASSSWENN